VRRPLILVPAALLFLLVALGLARFLTQENRERGRVEELLRLEARGDVRGVAGALETCDAGCRAKVGRFVPRVAGTGEVKIVRLDSSTSYSLGTAEGWSRVVWVRGPAGRPLVQCIRVRRNGSPLAGRTISLLRVTAPLADNEQSC
jgi:hypothetical protein